VPIRGRGEEVDLFARATLDEMYHSGLWERTADGLYCGPHERLPARLELPVRPKGDYDLEITFTLHDENNLMMRLPVGGRPCELWLASYGGRTMGFHLIEQPGVSFPAQAGRSPSLVKLGQKHTATARVRQTSNGWKVEALVDQQPAIGWEGTPDQLGFASVWDSPDMARPLIGQWPLANATMTLHAAHLKLAGPAPGPGK
jgi:hypothetical protein